MEILIYQNLLINNVSPFKKLLHIRRYVFDLFPPVNIFFM
jgi:hypothetical protein